MKVGQHLRTHIAAFPALYLALACMIFTIVVYYPGYMSPDSVVMLGMARTGVITNVYSPLMSYVWRVWDWVIAGPGGMLIFQNAVYWYSLAVIARYATANRLLGCLYVLTGLWIPNFAMLGTIWKDVGMQGFLLAAVAATLFGWRTRRVWPFVLAVVCLFSASGYRQNGILAAVPALIIVLCCLAKLGRVPRWIREKRLELGFYTAILGCVLVVFLAGLDLLNNYKMQDAKLWSGAMVDDLAGMSVLQSVNLLPPYVNPGGLTVDDLKHMYSPLHANSLFIPGSRQGLGVKDPSPDKVMSYTLTDAQADDLKLYWFTAVLDHFGSYLHNRFTRAEHLLVLHTGQPWYPYITDIDPNPFGVTFHHSSLNDFVTRWTQYAAFGTPAYSAWAYYAVVTLCVFASFLWRFRYALIVQLLGLSVWLYFVSIFMFGMSGDFRYNIWALSCAPLCLFLLCCGGPEASAAELSGGARPAAERSAESVVQDQSLPELQAAPALAHAAAQGGGRPQRSRRR